MDVSKYLNPKILDGSILGVDDLPNLQKSMGNRFGKVRFAMNGEDKPSRLNNLENTVIEQMQTKKCSDPICSVNDAIIGVANLQWGTKPLCATKIYYILQGIYNINTTTVMQMTGLGKRQSQRYVKACKILLPVLESTFKKQEEEMICPYDLIQQDVGIINDLGEY